MVILPLPALLFVVRVPLSSVSVLCSFFVVCSAVVFYVLVFVCPVSLCHFMSSLYCFVCVRFHVLFSVYVSMPLCFFHVCCSFVFFPFYVCVLCPCSCFVFWLVLCL